MYHAKSDISYNIPHGFEIAEVEAVDNIACCVISLCMISKFSPF
jgi:hypothetical protein